MKIALIKETKNPVDNRVALAPKQVAELNKLYPQHQIVVQTSDIRAFSDEQYRSEGVEVVRDVSDCDILFGIKEAKKYILRFAKYVLNLLYITWTTCRWPATAVQLFYMVQSF